MPINPASIRFPNVHKVFATIKGTVHFTPKLYIVDLLYVQEFYLNLISIARLIIDLHVSVLFDIPKWIIPDIKTNEMIGSGIIFEGLVYLEILKGNDDAVVNTIERGSQTLPKTVLWHFTLGHHSNQWMKMSHSDFPSILVDEGSMCNICHYAKQKKLSYSLGTSRASKLS